MIDGFDYLPYMRPHDDFYPWVAAQKLSEVRSAGAMQMQWLGSDLLTPATFNSNPGLATGISGDYYIDVKAGSYVWGVAAISNFLGQSHNFTNAGNIDPLEVEIIDAQTNESWWQSSRDGGDLGEVLYNELITWSQAVAGSFSEGVAWPIGFFIMQNKRLVLGDGQLIVRLTNNRFDDFGFSGGALLPQVCLFVSVPITGVRNGL